MIIHNGDHAQFEIDNAGVPPEQRSDWPWPSFDAMDWAKAFNKQFPAVSVDFALPWMASALMRGFDEARSRATSQTSGSPATHSYGQDGKYEWQQSCQCPACSATTARYAAEQATEGRAK